jgi:hypothetical protein
VHVLRSAYGSVTPYTRHSKSCEHLGEPNFNSCGCSKWLYVHPKGGKREQKTLTTSSWAEAVRIASKMLEGFNPDIAAARKTVKTTNPDFSRAGYRVE